MSLVNFGEEIEVFDLERALRSVGKECFVDYFYDFQNCLNQAELAQKLLDNNRNATSENAQATRVSKARRIFENQMEKEALDNIIASKRVNETVKAKARIIRDKL